MGQGMNLKVKWSPKANSITEGEVKGETVWIYSVSRDLIQITILLITFTSLMSRVTIRFNIESTRAEPGQMRRSLIQQLLQARLRLSSIMRITSMSFTL